MKKGAGGIGSAEEGGDGTGTGAGLATRGGGDVCGHREERCRKVWEGIFEKPTGARKDPWIRSIRGQIGQNRGGRDLGEACVYNDHLQYDVRGSILHRARRPTLSISRANTVKTIISWV